MCLLALLVGTSASEKATDAEAQEDGGRWRGFRTPCQVGEIPRKSALLPWVLNIS